MQIHFNQLESEFGITRKNVRDVASTTLDIMKNVKLNPQHRLRAAQTALQIINHCIQHENYEESTAPELKITSLADVRLKNAS